MAGMVAANTDACFREFVGRRLRGVLFDAETGGKTLIFDDGRGLHLGHNDTYHVVSAEDVAHALGRYQERLRKTEREIASVLALAGVLVSET